MSHQDDTFPCPRCGERLPAGFTRCDACGAYLVPAPLSVKQGGAGAAQSPRGGPAKGHGGHGGGGHGSGGHGGGAPRQANTSAVTTTAWVFLAIGLACGGVVGYSLHSSVGPRDMGGGAPTGPADVMAGMGGGGNGGGMGGGGMGGAPMAGGAMPADVMAHVQEYKAALARDPSDVQANIGYGNLLFDSGQWEKAVTHYQAALVKDPKNADVRVDMAIALHNLGQDPKAIQELERVTKESPGHKNAWLNLGVICSSTGDRKTAIQAWEKYLALDPNGPHAASIREQVQQLKSGA